MSQTEDNYQVVIAKYGQRTGQRSDVYLNYSLYHQDDGPIGMDYFFWVLRSPQRTVVVDTGFSRQGGDARSRTFVADVAELLAKLGVDPLAGPDVIVTHAHYDHIGNLNLFPRSRVFLAQRELDFWTSRHANRLLFHHSVEDDELSYLGEVRDEGRLELFEESVQVAPGIDVVVVGGHTPGQCVVRVRTDEGVVLLASDAVHYYEEYEDDMLFSSVANLVEMYEGFDRIHDLERSGEVRHVVSGHDPDTLGRFTPWPGELSGLVATIGSYEDGSTR